MDTLLAKSYQRPTEDTIIITIFVITDDIYQEIFKRNRIRETCPPTPM